MILVLILALAMQACAQSNSETDIDISSNSTIDWESENNALREENERLAQENERLQNQLATYQKEEKEAQEESTVQENDVTVLLTGKTQREEYGSPYVDFVFVVTNNTDKAIKGVQGKCIFSDLFGVEIGYMGCDFVGQVIEPGESITEKDLSLDCNRFNEKHMKIYNTALDDLIFEYEVTAIVFTDGTTKTVN